MMTNLMYSFQITSGLSSLFAQLKDGGIGDFKTEDIQAARKEYEELCKFSSHPITLIPHTVVKVEELESHLLEAYPKLVAMMKICSEKKVNNANNAWIEYLTLMKKKNAAETIAKVTLDVWIHGSKFIGCLIFSIVLK